MGGKEEAAIYLHLDCGQETKVNNATAMWHVEAVRRFARLIPMRRLAAPATPGRERQAQIRLIASKWESDCSQVDENSHQAGREAAAGAWWRAQRRVKAGKKLYAIPFNR